MRRPRQATRVLSVVLFGTHESCGGAGLLEARQYGRRSGGHAKGANTTGASPRAIRQPTCVVMRFESWFARDSFSGTAAEYVIGERDAKHVQCFVHRCPQRNARRNGMSLVQGDLADRI